MDLDSIFSNLISKSNNSNAYNTSKSPKYRAVSDISDISTSIAFIQIPLLEQNIVAYQ